MSHFFTVVLVENEGSSDLVKIETKVTELLAPYSEHIEVAPYATECWCIGYEAYLDTERIINRTHGTIDKWSERFIKDYPISKNLPLEELIHFYSADRAELWLNYKWPREEALYNVFKNHPDFGKASVTCRECSGTGKRFTTRNPKSKWDWWVISDRFDGVIQRNMSLASELSEDFRCFAIITPNGEWHEKSRKWWFTTNPDEKKNWEEDSKKILEQYKDCLAIGCDLHV